LLGHARIVVEQLVAGPAYTQKRKWGKNRGGINGMENVRPRSRSLRHCPERKISLCPPRPDFPVVFKGYAGGLFTFSRAKRPKFVSPGRFSLNLMTAVIW